MSNLFYYDATGQKLGPVTLEQVQNLVTKGIITPKTPMEADGGHKGFAGKLNGIKFPQKPTLPPVPKPQDTEKDLETEANELLQKGERLLESIDVFRESGEAERRRIIAGVKSFFVGIGGILSAILGAAIGGFLGAVGIAANAESSPDRIVSALAFVVGLIALVIALFYYVLKNEDTLSGCGKGCGVGCGGFLVTMILGTVLVAVNSVIAPAIIGGFVGGIGGCILAHKYIDI